MPDPLSWLERAVRNAHTFDQSEPADVASHPFPLNNVHLALPSVVRALFDNGHYSQATFEAFKYLDNVVKKLAGIDKSGKALMMDAFKDASPLLQVSPLADETDRNIQEGYRFIFAGSMIGIRNPRGHEHAVADSVDTCLDHLRLVSHLLRTLEVAGYDVTAT